VIHGDVLELWQRMAPVGRQVQIAGHPGRHEPDRADTEGQAFLRALDQSGYRGWVSAEYVPRGSTEAGIGWVGNL
jgi:hydroxypyruvate isomerase